MTILEESQSFVRCCLQCQWLGKQPVSLTENQYLKEALSLLETVLSQNIEPDPDGGSKIIDGVSPDRRISITDSDMRHGRKSSSRTINGFKQHIAIDLDHKFILPINDL